MDSEPASATARVTVTDKAELGPPGSAAVFIRQSIVNLRDSLYRDVTLSRNGLSQALDGRQAEQRVLFFFSRFARFVLVYEGHRSPSLKNKITVIINRCPQYRKLVRKSSQSLLLAKFSSSPSQHSSINIDNSLSLINFRFITNAFERQYFRSLTFSRSSRPFRFFNALLLILVSNCNVNMLSLNFSRTTAFLAILKFSR